MPSNIPQNDQGRPSLTNGPELGISDMMQITVERLGCVVLGSNWRFADLSSHFWRLYLHDVDGAEAIIARRSWPLRGGHPLLIPPWLHWASRPGHGVRQVFVHFASPGLSDTVLRRSFQQPIDLYPAPFLVEGLSHLGERLTAGQQPGAGDLLRAKALVCLALAQACEGLTSGAIPLTQLYGLSPLRTLAAAVDADPGADWSTTGFARQLGCSTDHTTRLFSRHLGATPARFVAERRLVAAARALVAGRDDIETIAVAHGFANRFSFTRSFIRRFGTGPAAYRKRA